MTQQNKLEPKEFNHTADNLRDAIGLEIESFKAFFDFCVEKGVCKKKSHLFEEIYNRLIMGDEEFTKAVVFYSLRGVDHQIEEMIKEAEKKMPEEQVKVIKKMAASLKDLSELKEMMESLDKSKKLKEEELN